MPRPTTAADLEGMTRVDGGSFLGGSLDPADYPDTRGRQHIGFRCVVREG